MGWNHPWIAYGHDFGPAWGHDGLSTGGWTHETFVDTRGFTATRVVRDAAGAGSLRITAELRGGDPSRSSGEVHLSLVDHWPFACPTPDTPTSVDLDGALIRYRIRLAAGSAGPPSTPNGLQIVVKTRHEGDLWSTMVGRWENVRPEWEGRDVSMTARVTAADAAHADPGFDPTRVSLVGLKLGINAASTAAVNGFVHLDEFSIESKPVLAFDFERLPIERDIQAVQDLTAGALSLVRVFVFCDGRASPSFAPDGGITGLDERFFADFDALVEAAEQHHVRLIPVLLDFHWCAHARMVAGVQLGGHAEIIQDARLRRTFLERALRPLLQRYGSRSAIYAWDLVNEPEWVIRGMPGASQTTHDLVSWSEMREFAAACTQYVHRFAPAQLVTIGSARRRWMPLWIRLGLDLYQFHWYEGLGDPFPWPPYSELGLDKPCIVGEVPTARARHTPHESPARRCRADTAGFCCGATARVTLRRTSAGFQFADASLQPVAAGRVQRASSVASGWQACAEAHACAAGPPTGDPERSQRGHRGIRR